MADKVGSGQSTCASETRLPAYTKWSDTFLMHLAADVQRHRSSEEGGYLDERRI